MAKKSKKNKLLLFGKIILIINWIAVISLIISNLAHFVSPEKLIIFAFFGIAFPYLIAINFLFIVYWLLRRRWQVVYSIIGIAFSWTMLTKFIQFNASKDNDLSSTSNTFKILSYNVRVFDLYHYDKHWVSNTEKRNEIFSYITQEKPDIICFQEFVDDKTGKFKILDTLPYFQKAKNYHFEYTKNVRNINYFGIATFTKYPIVNKGKILFSKKSSNLCIYTDIKIKDKIIRIYNVHLQSIKLGEDEYEFAERIRNFEDIDKDNKFKTESSIIINRLRKAFIRRATQVDLVAENIKSCPYPYIICGDFNDTPSSYAYYTLSKNIKDAFCESGNGFSQTFVEGTFPSFRIDYILHSKQLTSFDYFKGDVKYSDHYPVECSIRF